MSKPPRAGYRTTNWKSYNAALAQRGSLQVWFDPEMQWLSAPAGKRVRQPVFSDAAIQACLTLKGVFKLALRQTTGMVASLFEMAGLDWLVPDFSTLSRRQTTLLVEITCQPSSGPLHLLIDSTGMKAVGDGEWCRRKHGPSKRRQWRKVHLGVDLGSSDIRAIEVTGSRVGDAPILPELLEQIPHNQAIASVSADGAFETRTCHEAIAARDACAIIPARSNAQAWPENTPGVAARNEPEMKLFAQASGSAGKSGNDGAAITSAVWSKRECIASNCWANASWHETSIARSPKCKSAPPSSTASPPSEGLKRSVSHNRMPSKAECYPVADLRNKAH